MKILIILLILSVTFLTACGSIEPEIAAGAQEAAAPTAGFESAPQEVAEPDSAVADDDIDEIISEDSEDAEFAFAMGAFVIEMDQNIAHVLDMLGEPLGVFEAPSCAFDGIDRIFSYPGVQIHTYPEGDDDFVHTISLRDDSVRTMGGIYLGNSPDAVFDAYGDGYEQEFGMFTYTRGMTTLSFYIENDMVLSITYGLIMQQ